MTLIAVALAGALGAPARYIVERATRARLGQAFPWGTFVVNVSGSLALGALTGLVLFHAFDVQARTVIGTGFLGAYTTFSTFAYESVRLAEGRPTRAVAVRYLAASTIAPGARAFRTLLADIGGAVARLGVASPALLVIGDVAALGVAADALLPLPETVSA